MDIVSRDFLVNRALPNGRHFEKMSKEKMVETGWKPFLVGTAVQRKAPGTSWSILE